MTTTVDSSSDGRYIPGLIRLLRPRQWIKNLFVLAPLIFSGEFVVAASVFQAFTAMALFCLASSIVYVINDLHDVEQDRSHPIKAQTRPLAAGSVSPRQAYGLLVLLGLLLLLGSFWTASVFWVILAYVGLNVAYTWRLKHEPVVDIFCIAIGFVLRVYAGAVVLAVPLSSWMFVTTLCLALFLAAIKRRQELMHSGHSGRKVLENYSVALVDRFAEMSATGALIFYSLFAMTTNSNLVITIPLVLFGLFRYWYVVEREGAGESPTDVLVSDGKLLLTTIAWALACAWALRA